mmetsp:Transcript_17277/g.36694  ORF Transcript_17277/g.36694 Transcript_17277/m.36694 type:complete len:110 (-) Transcript_17277:265-594(-)
MAPPWRRSFGSAVAAGAWSTPGRIRLNREIIAARSAGQILALFETRHNDFDDVNAVTALHRIAKSPDAQCVRGGPLLRALEAQAGAAAAHGNLAPYGLANTAWAISVLR